MTTECGRGDAASEWCHPRKPKAPAPTRAGPLAAGGGILLGRQLTSRAAPAPALAALMQARPRARRQAAPGESWRSAPSCSLPAAPPGFPSEESTAPGWFLTDRPSGGKKMCLCPNQFLPSALPRLLGRIRASQPGHVCSDVKGSRGSQPLPGDGPGCPRYLVPAGAKETARITREPYVCVARRRRASGVEVVQPGLVSIALCWANKRVALKFTLGPPGYWGGARGLQC